MHGWTSSLCVGLILVSLLQARTPAQVAQAGGPGKSALPALVSYVAPLYPPLARSAQISGIVEVETTVGADGRVRLARVTRSTPILDRAALDAVKQWQFSVPDPAPVIVLVRVEFLLGVAAPAEFEMLPDWPGGEFWFEYVYTCGAVVRIRPDSFAFSHTAPGGMLVPLQFEQSELETIVRRLRALDARAERLHGGPVQEMRQLADAVEVRLLREPPSIDVMMDGPRYDRKQTHTLDIWVEGGWNRFSWSELFLGGNRTVSHDGLDSLGAFIRQTVARMPGVRELPDDQRWCLPD